MTKTKKPKATTMKKITPKISLDNDSFHNLVYKLCKDIPKGYVTTYGEIAKALHRPNASRAVGNALRKNPYAPIVPCHRVITSSRTIGGFCGCKAGPEILRKIQLLKEESVRFDEDGKVSTACIYKFNTQNP